VRSPRRATCHSSTAFFHDLFELSLERVEPSSDPGMVAAKQGAGVRLVRAEAPSRMSVQDLAHRREPLPRTYSEAGNADARAEISLRSPARPRSPREATHVRGRGDG